MEDSLSKNYTKDYYIPRPKSITPHKIPPTPINTPVSECSYMLQSFQKICNCKDFTDQKLQEECREVFNEIKESCFENKN